MQMGGLRPAQFARDLWREFSDDDLTGMAAELTYRAFLAIFPFLIFLVALGGLVADLADVNNPADRVVDLLGDNLPADAESIVRDQVAGVVNERDLSLLSIAALGTLWAAAGASTALIKCLNRVYDVPDRRPWWKKIALSLALTASISVGLVLSVALLAGTQGFGHEIAEDLGIGDEFGLIIRLVAWPILLFLIMTGAAFAYWLAPDVDVPFKWISPGAVLFAVGGVATSVLAGLYVANFGSYNETYGSLGGIVVLLFWFYLTSVVLLLGAEFNALLDEHAKGPVLEERQRAAVEAVQDKAEKQPANPDAVIPPEPSRPDAASGDAVVLPAPSDGRQASPPEPRVGPVALVVSSVTTWLAFALVVLLTIRSAPRRGLQAGGPRSERRGNAAR
jgi:membrane protein